MSILISTHRFSADFPWSTGDYETYAQIFDYAGNNHFYDLGVPDGCVQPVSWECREVGTNRTVDEMEQHYGVVRCVFWS